MSKARGVVGRKIRTNGMVNAKVVVITGASRGIGYETAKLFAQSRAKLVLNAMDEARIEQVIKELVETYGVEAISACGDVSEEEVSKSIFKKAQEHFGGVDVLVNNAGIVRDTLIVRMKSSDWDDVLKVDLRSVFLMSREAVKMMMKKKSGSIVNLSSVVALAGSPGQTNYSAAKGGILSFSRSLAREVGAWGIRVNAVCPGYIRTDMTDKLSEEYRTEIQKGVVLGRMGEASDVANTILFLASDRSSYITGETISVNGGIYM